MSTLHPHTRIVRSPKVAQRLFEEAMLCITIHDSRLHRLNTTGTFIWEQLSDPLSLQELCQRVADHFEGADPRAIALDVQAFAGEMLRKRLIQIHEKAQT